jgi:hypothetical protein
MKNVFGDPLEPCREPSHDTHGGSWNPDSGQCDETGGGVHQICLRINDTAADFSQQTSQNRWSETRVAQNHCVCLGAYALHAAKNADDDDDALDLKCSAIPARALSAEYITQWSTWNSHEKVDQMRDGVKRLVKTCRASADTKQKLHNLNTLSCKLADDMRKFAKETPESGLFGENISDMLHDLGCKTNTGYEG